MQPIAAQVAQTTVELTFALPAQPITLEALGTMHLGQLIRLAANVHDPVQVTSRGIKLFDAGLSFGGNRMAFELFEPAAAKTTANSLERGG